MKEEGGRLKIAGNCEPSNVEYIFLDRVAYHKDRLTIPPRRVRADRL